MIRDKLVTVIGGGGFIGRYVAQALLREGARLRVAQRDPRQAWFLKSLGQLGGTQLVAADIRSPDSIARAVHGSHAVVNLVGVLGGDFAGVHVDGAQNVARAAREAGAEALLHMSAIGADPDAPSAYGRTKGEGEAAVREAFPDAVIFRPSVVFGREDRFTNRFARMIEVATNLPGRIVPILAPQAKLQPVFVGDVADAAVVALKDWRVHKGRTYELGGPDVLTIAELNRFIARETGRNPRFVELPDAVGAAIAKAGWLPGAPITTDQWRMLQRGSVAAAGAAGLDAFGVTPTPLQAVAPGYLVQYRRAGRFGRRAAELENA